MTALSRLAAAARDRAVGAIGAAPRWLWILFFIGLSSPFWSLGHPLIEVDDARYAEVPREMAQTGDWATPTLDYFDYVEKPPLWYWLAAVSYKTFGVSEASARLPLALLSAFGLAWTAWLGWWLLSPRVGLLASAALSSAGLYFFLGHYITPDLPLTVFLLACSALILRCLTRPEDAPWAAPAAWAAVALAFLSKGLVAFLFPAVWTALLVVASPAWRRRSKALLRPLGPTLFLLIAAPWFLLMERRHPGFLRFFFGEQHFQRFMTQKYNRTSPWYFFLLVLPAGLLPWTGPALAGAWQALAGWRRRPETAALAAWSVMVLAFFSLSQSKLATYILPALPHLALLGAWAAQRPAPATRRACLGLGALLASAALAATLALRVGWPSLPPQLSAAPGAAFAALLALAALAAGLVAHGLGRSVRALAVSGWIAGAVALFVMRTEADALSVKSLSHTLMELYRSGDQIYSYGIYLHGVPFYCQRPVDRVVNWTGELHYAFRDPAQAARRGDDDVIRVLPAPGHGTFVVLRAADARDLLSLVDAAKIQENRVFGRWVLLKL